MRLWLMLFVGVSTGALAQDALTPAGGGGCADVAARYRAVQDNDLAMGHVNKSVYAQIQKEIEAAEKVCAAGQDSKAISMIRASQARHGYPTSI